MKKQTRSVTLLIICLSIVSCNSKTDTVAPPDDFLVMAYYAGNETAIHQYDVSGLTHIIFSFCHLEGNQMIVPAPRLAMLNQLAALKNDHPDLKIILALGGWGGCETCSEVFSSAEGRSEFALSVKQLLEQHQADGIDLDWEYPAIPGYPGHQYMPEDKQNFTALVKELRDVLGSGYEIGFAAGGFKRFFDESVEWDKVMPLVDYVNIMTYDLVSGASPVTGHHTPLYSSAGQTGSADYAVSYLDSIGVDPSKMVIGAAFYGRAWRNVPAENNGLYQPGVFKKAITYNDLEGWMEKNSLQVFWDDTTKAPFAYSEENGLFVTYDDRQSVMKKTRYAKERQLAGIMFWQLGGDKPDDGLLEAIYQALE